MISACRTLLDDLRADTGYAARTLLKAPGFLVAVVSLGVAVGASAAVYGTVDWLLNRAPTGVVEPERLVGLRLTERGREQDDRARFSFSYPQYEALGEAQDAFTEIAAYGKLLMFAGGDDWREQVVYQFVSGTYFPLLGVRPAIGRLIGPEDDVPGAYPAVVLSHELWQSRFGGDPDVVGRPITLQGGDGRVVGVMPSGFEDFSLDWNAPTGLWIPFGAADAVGMEIMRTAPVTFFPIMGRLRPGVDMAEAVERAQRWVGGLPEVRISTIDPNAISVRSASELRISRRDEAGAFLGALLVVCVLILVAACSNVANFFLGRAARRRREVALRTALGARRSRILRQLSTEALLLGLATALLSGAVGVWVASVLAGMPNLYLDLPMRAGGVTTEGALDARMLLSSIGVAVVVAFGVALLPMLGTLGDPVVALRGSVVRWGWGRFRPTPRQGLLAFQVGLAVVLSVTAALYAQGFWHATKADPEYADTSTLLFARIASVDEPLGDYTPFYESLLDRIRSEPWAVSASLRYNQPYAGGFGTAAHLGDPDGAFDIDGAATSPGMFATLGVPLVAGRDVREGDGRDVAIINRTLAERLWPGERAVGRSFNYTDEPVRVIGVVARERCSDLLAPPKGCAWRVPTEGGDTRTVYVRTAGPASEAIPYLRPLVEEVGPRMAIVEVHSVDAYLDQRLRAERVATVASSGLALFGMALLVIGSVSLFVSMVRDSLREIAIRMALGATDGRIMATVLGHGLLIAAVGVLLGAGSAIVVAGRLEGQFYAVSATDLPTFLLVSTLILLVAAGSVGYAARTATRTHPAEHLQSD